MSLPPEASCDAWSRCNPGKIQRGILLIPIRGSFHSLKHYVRIFSFLSFNIKHSHAEGFKCAFYSTLQIQSKTTYITFETLVKSFPSHSFLTWKLEINHPHSFSG